MRKKILFRVDSSSRIGLGHLKRSLVYAAGLPDAEIVFACRDLPGNINSQIPYPIHTLAASDAQELIDLCKQLQIDQLIVDNYELTLEDEKKIKANCSLRLSIFDDTYQQHYCDEVINHNLGAQAKKYALKVPSFCKISLISPLIRQEFFEEKKQSRPRKGIFLSLGGTDPKNLILRVLKMLKPQGIQVNVAVTSSNANLKSLYAYAKVNRWVKLHVDGNIAKLLNSCELAIVTPSVLAAEALFMSAPIITIRTAENQTEVEKYLKQQRFTTLKASEFHKLRDSAVIQKAHPRKMIRYASSTDGFTLHQASDGDLLDLYSLANDPLVRQNSFSSHAISLEEHTKWFAAVLDDDSIVLYTVRSQTNALIGQVRFNKIGKKAIISLSVCRDFRGRSMAAAIIKKACETFLNDNANMPIEAQIKKENIASEKSFQKAGFKRFNTEEGRLYYLYGQEHE